MTSIRKLITVWMLTLVGSILLPAVSMSTVSATMHDILSMTTIQSVISTEYITVTGTVGSDSELHGETDHQAQTE